MEELLAALQQKKIVVQVDEDIKDLIPGFLANRQQDIVNLQRALAAGDFQSIQFIAHGLKGSGAGYGFDFISQLGRRLEEAAKSKQETLVKQLIDLLPVYLQRIELQN
ncbi:MAG: Hpt domain-containing protein [Bacillota bacterium]|uniref:Hpt domain-containing protein n=1 Tax=Desulfurispora thermophila TaxID=265470 RepID=UPI0003777D64|nr:Hpt domain-containing protein [Desulfurispora thermophila]